MTVMNAHVRCAACGLVVPVNDHLVFVERTACCSEVCANTYARTEVERLRGYLKRIVSRTRGFAADMASSALYSNVPAGQ